MGLQNQVNDISPDSLPILVLMFIGDCIYYIHRFLFAILRFLCLSRFFQDQMPDDDFILGGGIVADHLKLNNKISYSYNLNSRVDREAADCIVCLNRLRNGDRVRRLVCRHVFHKHCFDGCLKHYNFNCPLCRTPVVLSGGRVRSTF